MDAMHRVDTLFAKYIQKTISAEELEEMLVWLYQIDDNRAEQLSAPMQALWQQAKAGELPSTADHVDWERVFEQVVRSDGHTEAAPVRHLRSSRKIWLRITAAAAILVILFAAGYYLWRQPAKKAVQPEFSQRTPESVLPGRNNATLTLADGSVITLDSAANGTLATQNGTLVTKTDSGKLAYNSTAGNGGRILYNTISTPRGGQYEVTLPDGSKVWLNAASSLRFPTVFTGSQRLVELTGEGYFEIADRRNQPFTVTVNHMTVEVLGTHFNIMAYQDETTMKTTLLQGKVRVLENGVSTGTVLAPGQQAQLGPDGQVKLVRDANTEMAVAWKNGYFWFDRADIKTILRQVGRWYDLDINYEGTVPDRRFSGKIERNLPLSAILHLLEQANIHFRITDKTMTVIS